MIEYLRNSFDFNKNDYSHETHEITRNIFSVSFTIRLDARGQRRSLYETTFQKLELVLTWAALHFGLSLFQALLGFVALNPTHILPVLLRNAKPNNGRFRNRAPKVSFSIKPAIFLTGG
jgi:hypothetical protein